MFHVQCLSARVCRCESQAGGQLRQWQLEKGNPRQLSIWSFSSEYQASPPLLGGSPALSFLPCAEGSHNVDGDEVALLLLGFRLFLAFCSSFDVNVAMGVGFSLYEILRVFLEKIPIPLEQSQVHSRFGENCRIANGYKEGM